MTNAVKSILSQAASLSESERVELAQALIESLEAEEEGVDAAWEAELNRRVADIKSGKVVGRPLDQVFARFRNRPA